MPQRDQEIALLRREIELMMGERQALLRVAGSAAVLIAITDRPDPGVILTLRLMRQKSGSFSSASSSRI